MNKLEIMQQLFSSGQGGVSVLAFSANVVVASLLSILLGMLYSRYGTSLSNRRQFSSHFVLLTATTVLIITVVKSSLALSLGLVGALSIVRFRAAIKEPEELAFLFLAISIGLGFGADQRAITVAGFVLIAIIIILRGMKNKAVKDERLYYLSIRCPRLPQVGLERIADIVKAHCANAHLKRFDQSSDTLESLFLVGCDSLESIQKLKEEMEHLDDRMEITFFDYKQIG